MQRAPFTLGKLSAQDVVWFTQYGNQQAIAPDTLLIEEGSIATSLYFVLEGAVAAIVTTPEERYEVGQLQAGDLLGSLAFVDGRFSPIAFIAVVPTQVLAVAYSVLAAQLKQDPGFAARFYQTIAASLSHQLRGISALLVRSKAGFIQPLRKVLLVFAELNDSDVDWMVSVGQAQRAIADTILIQEGTFADALYLLMEGSLAVSITVTVDGVKVSKQVARLAAGEIVGEISFVDAQPPSATVTALEGCLVLALPRDQLLTKIQQDDRFATRFYRALSVVLADRLRDRLVSHGYGNSTYEQDQAIDEDMEYNDELDLDLLDHVAIAGVRFDWLLRRLQVHS